MKNKPHSKVTVYGDTYRVIRDIANTLEIEPEEAMARILNSYAKRLVRTGSKSTANRKACG